MQMNELSDIKFLRTFRTTNGQLTLAKKCIHWPRHFWTNVAWRRNKKKKKLARIVWLCFDKNLFIRFTWFGVFGIHQYWKCLDFYFMKVMVAYTISPSQVNELMIDVKFDDIYDSPNERLSILIFIYTFFLISYLFFPSLFLPSCYTGCQNKNGRCRQCADTALFTQQCLHQKYNH